MVMVGAIPEPSHQPSGKTNISHKIPTWWGGGGGYRVVVVVLRITVRSVCFALKSVHTYKTKELQEPKRFVHLKI